MDPEWQCKICNVTIMVILLENKTNNIKIV
jgi:hypothetical protein